MTSADIDRAIQLVTEAPRSTVSTPVWNMLLGMIGREGRLELMWKTFNDVSSAGSIVVSIAATDV
jgi:pentatricopeptide repeat protein